MLLDRTVKNVIWKDIINYNSFKLQFNAVILKDRKKNRELIVFVIIRYLFQSKKGFLLFLIVRGKVRADYKNKPSIW
jgi:hypothetical protein